MSVHRLVALASLVPFLWLAPVPAHACGGTFCDNQPDPMPVDQTGEDILFVLDGSTVEVHIRIEYTGEAERFAWVVPLQAIPEDVTIGSEPLFTALSNAVAPDWRTKTEYDCPEDPGEDDGDTNITTLGFVPSSDLSAASEPDVVFQETVGAFEVVVLQGGTAAEVIDFLDANDYAQDPDSEPILQEYLDEGFLFAAIKLTARAEVGEIHPLVFRFPGNEPCVPLRLTRIAAEDDMGVRTYFLGQERWVPSNYRHVELNPLAYDWQLTGPARYLELLSMAIDEAGGRGFVTEYAGPSDVVQTWTVYSPDWNEAAFIGVHPMVALDIIAQQGLGSHPLIASLLMEFIPPPDGVDPQDFWNLFGVSEEDFDLEAWDDVAFAAALVERIIEPGMHAANLLDAWPKLTRMNTVISPHEMLVDPVFHTNASIPDVNRASVTTIQQVMCGGDRLYHVDVSGQDMPVCVPEYEAYPGWENMPASLWSEQIPMVGAPQIVYDNRDAVASAYELYQAGVQCEIGDGDGDGTGDGGPGDGDGGDPSDSDGTSGKLPADMMSDSACACAVDRGAAPVAVSLGVLVLGLIGPWRRRNRVSSV